MKQILLLAICLAFVTANKVSAQNAHFTTDGIIEYQKSINTYALIKKNINKDNESYMQRIYDQYKNTQPQFKQLKSTLTFSKTKTLFTPTVTNENNPYFGNDPAMGQPNTIFTDLAASSSVTQKKVYEETFLVKDSVRNIKWKITDETREIAGFSCRRANALILDSIYVVAFYTDQIPVSGGPESFTGLPGMILGVALPHENVTWFATSVTDRAIIPSTIAPPAKGKVVNNKTFRQTITGALKDWGDYAQSAFKAFLL
ncbi:GLPGLI family protein [Hufsiella ginkgonis]|uniref:GLPGLI family protein n=1 Tax=Hufsiella ginkgonis TaxID=2695274 RepID=A0A7K1XRU8_9SPHI|nr:GLPGLI family protein [Hufsiella ginkgonis]MXV13712.1 GLPGLI family protein [Hufsiella ginkgonis]